VSALEPTGVFISEFLAENETGLRDEDGDQEDWIELFNADTAPANVGGWWLSDDPALPTKWAIPPASRFPPRLSRGLCLGEKPRGRPGASAYELQAQQHRGKPSLAGAIGRRGRVVLRRVSKAQRADHSYGAYASYTPRGYFITPTPGAPNDATGYAGFVADTEFSVKRGFYTTPQGVVVTCADAGRHARSTRRTAPRRR
jgi:hypothetical protein